MLPAPATHRSHAAPLSARVSRRRRPRHRGPRSLLTPFLLMLLACIVLATSCADTPTAGPRLRGARAAIGIDSADWGPPPPCPPLDDSVFPPDLQAPATVEAGSIEGSFSVAPSGEAVYSIPLDVPPGRAGMEPALSVTYDSASGEGPLGVGFSIAGLSAITRCPKNMADDGVVAAVQDDFRDPLCLDGKRLVPVLMPIDDDGSPSYFPEYRTVPDTFSKIVPDLGEDEAWNLHRGPRSFTVYTKSGLILEYGSSANSRVLSRDGVVRQWLVTEVRDRWGNTVEHSYINSLHPSEGYTVEYAPDRIDYTGHPDAPATRAVVFEYSPLEQPDVQVLYARGMELRRSLRLNRIAMLAPQPALVREYLFSYTAGAATGRTLLAQIQECAPGGACKPPTRFLWHTGGSPGFMTLPTTIAAPESPRGSLMTLDMTGDGLEDLVLSDVDMTGGSENPYTNWTVAPNLGSEITPSYFDAPHHAYQHGHPGAAPPIQPELGTPLDYNQDGRMDILVHDMYAIDSTWHVLLAQPDGTFANHDTGIQRLFTLSSPPPLLLRHPEASVHLADVDGDGVSDLIQCAFNGTEYNWYLHRWVPSVPGFTQEEERIDALYGYHCDVELHTVDVDIDGKVDLLVPEGTMTGNGVSLGNYLEALSYVHSSEPWRRTPLGLAKAGELGRIHFLDVNGDGLPDAVRTGTQDGQPLTAINTGTGFSAQVNSLQAPILDADQFAGIAVPLDYNGDGRHDLLLPMPGSNGVPSWRILQSTGSVTDGTFVVVDPGLPIDVQLLAGAPPTLVDPRGPRVTDIDGDGVQDLLLTLSDTVQIFKSTLHEEDLLAGVVDGLAAREPWEPAFRPRVEIDYAHLIDLDTTTAGQAGVPAAESRTYLLRDGITAGGCAYPVRCVVGPRRVVSGYRLDTAVAEPRRFEIAYRDGRYHRLGRGFLGFSARIIRDLDTGSGTAEYYDNVTYDGQLDTFPFAGQLVEEHRWAPTLSYDGQPGEGPIELRYTSYTPHAVPLLGGRTHFNITGITTLRRMQGRYDPQAGQSVEAHVRETAVSGAAEELGTTLHVISDYDDHGNVLSETTSTPGADLTITVERTVENDEAAWHLGMVELLRECSTARGMTRCRTTTREHGSRGQVDRELWGSAPADPETENGIRYHHDSMGNVVGVIAMDAYGDRRHACTRYDAEGLFPAVHRNPEGHVTRLKHHLGLGVLMASIDPSSRVTRWARDGFGRVTREERPDGTETIYALTRTKDGGPLQDQWTIKQWIQKAGHRSDTIEHDSLGRAVRWWSQGVQLGGWPAWRLVQEIGFDALGERVAWRTVPRPDPAPPFPPVPFDSYEYDSMGRLVRHVTPWLAETTYRYDGGTVVVTRPGDSTTMFENDALGRPVRIVEPYGVETNYGYGPFGGLWSVIDAGGAETLTERDAYGRVRRQVDPDRGETRLHYNGYGELTSSLDAAQREVTLERDGLGRLVRRTDQDGVTLLRWDTAPNGIGQLAEVESPEGHLRSYQYDAFGRMTQTSLSIDGETLGVGVTYDAYGRPEVLRYPEAPGVGPFEVRREYDAWGHLIAVRDQATGAPFWEATSADGAGRITVESLGGGAALTTRSFYNDRNRVHSIHTLAGGAVVQDLSYEYDARLNVSRRADAVHGQQELFIHDKLDRLTCSRFGLSQVCTNTYQYAPNGNLTQKPGVGAYTYDPNDKPHAVRTAGWQSYGYDEVGNQVSRPGVTIGYTAFDLPKTFTFAQGGMVELTYDGLGQRIRKRGLTEEVVYFDELYERVSRLDTGEVEHRYHVGSGERVVATVARRAGAADEVRYLHMDALGSVDVVTDPSGAVVEERSYDAFGARRAPVWAAGPPASFTSETRLGFTGHEGDEELGLVNMKGRVYDPKLGRFLTPDPVIAKPHFSQGWNSYSYVLNSPLAYVDPTGFAEEDAGPPQGDRLIPVPSPNPDEYWFQIPPEGGGAPPPERPDPPVDMAYYGAAPPPVDVGVWGTWGFVAPPRVPGLEQAKRIVQVEVAVVRGAAEQVGEIALETGKFGVLNLMTLGGYGTYKLGRALWDGYKEDGAVGAANAINPIYHFLKNGIDSYEAAARGDYRAAGRSGVTSLLAAVTTVLGAAGAAEALAAKGGLGAAGAGRASKTPRQLQLPFVPAQPLTRGVLTLDSGVQVPLASGTKGPAAAVPRGTPGFDAYTRTHVEGHAAAIMRAEQSSAATLHINNPQICSNCSRLLPDMLPPGSQLTVVLPNGTRVPFTGNNR